MILNDVRYSLEITSSADGAKVRAVKAGDAFGSTPYAETTTSYSTGQWHHAVAVFSDLTLRAVYLDGGGKGTDTTIKADIGASTIRMGLGFGGQLDDVRIYDRALSDEEVLAIYNAGNAGDTTPPSILTLSPADNATGVSTGSTLQITFDETIGTTGTGYLTIRKVSDDSIVEQINTATGAVTGSGTATITINLADFETSTAYYVQIDANAFPDEAGNFFGGIDNETTWNFTTTAGDITPPAVETLSPADNATDVSTTANLVITFDEATRAGTGTLVIKRTSNDSTVETITVSGALLSGNGTTQLTLNPSTTLAESTGYYVTWTANAFKDAAGNHVSAVTSKTAWNFTTGDFTTPSISTLSPTDDATDVATTANLVITFNEAVTLESGNITIKKSSDDSIVEVINLPDGPVTGGGTATITINPIGTLQGATSYYVQIAATAIDDLSGNGFAGISDKTTWNFTTAAAADTTPPTVQTLSPADNATDVSATANLVITFDETIGTTGTGYLTIRKVSDDSIVEQINTATGAVTGSGTATITINLADFETSTAYYVQIDANAFPDEAGNFFGGISDETTWNFTTAAAPAPNPPTITSPVSGTTTTDTTPAISGTGSSVGNTIRAYSGATVLCTTTVNNDGPKSWTCNSSSLTDGTYTLHATEDDESESGSSNTVTLTIGTTPPSIQSLSPADNAADVSATANLVITFNEVTRAGTGTLTIQRSADDSTVETITVSGALLSGNGSTQLTLNPATTHSGSTAYYITWTANAFKDRSDHHVPAQTSTTYWNFTTVDPSASSSSSSSSSEPTTEQTSGGGGGGGRRRSAGSLQPRGASPSSAGHNAAATASSSLPAKYGRLVMALEDREVLFRDVPVSEWFAGFVHDLLRSGIASGYKDTQGNPTGSFGPGNPVTYAEIAKMALMAGKHDTVGLSVPQNRSARRHWSQPYIALAEQLRFSAYAPFLDVNTPASRKAVIQTLLEALDIPIQANAPNPFRDLRTSNPYANAVLTATALGIISGDTDAGGKPTGTVRPNDPINRAEVAKMIVTALEALGQ